MIGASLSSSLDVLHSKAHTSSMWPNKNRVNSSVWEGLLTPLQCSDSFFNLYLISLRPSFGRIGMFGGQVFEIELDTWVLLYWAFIMNFRLQVLLKKFQHSVSQWQMILDLGSGTVWALRDTISRKELVNRNRSLGPKQSTFPASLLNTYTLKYMKTYILYLCHLLTFIKLFYFYKSLIEMAFDWFKKKGEKL